MKAQRCQTLLLLLSTLVLGSSLSAQSYTPVFLGSGHQIYVRGVNDSGMSVGRQGISYSAALLWSPSGAVKNLGTLGGKFADAYAINNLGQVVGSSTLAGNMVVHAFFWTSTGGMQDLGSLGGGNSFAYAINDNSTVVGEFTGNSIDHAFLWTQGGGMQDLGTLGGNFGRALGINSAGHVVGSAALSDGSIHAFFWTSPNGMKEIDLGSTTSSQAFAINDSDQVVGAYINPSDNGTHAFLWDATHGIKDLGILPQVGSISYASAINNSGDVVGIAYVMRSGKIHGYSVIWTQGGAIKKLGPLVVPKIGLPKGATGINASGQIVANGAGAWLLTPQ